MALIGTKAFPSVRSGTFRPRTRRPANFYAQMEKEFSGLSAKMRESGFGLLFEKIGMTPERKLDIPLPRPTAFALTSNSKPRKKAPSATSTAQKTKAGKSVSGALVSKMRQIAGNLFARNAPIVPRLSVGAYLSEENKLDSFQKKRLRLLAALDI